MDDRRLLEMAAKAAGITLFGAYDSAYGFGLNSDTGREPRRYWSPLTSDGDALRLAVKLNISLVITPEHGVSARCAAGPWCAWCDEDQSADLYAATRRAIVRAAAEIGRQMGEAK